MRQHIISREHGIELIRLNGAKVQKRMALKLDKNGVSVKDLRAAVDKRINPPTPFTSAPAPPRDTCLAKYVGKGIHDERHIEGLHRYDIAQGFRPIAHRIFAPTRHEAIVDFNSKPSYEICTGIAKKLGIEKEFTQGATSQQV